jgi:hypothetical protein
VASALKVSTIPDAGAMYDNARNSAVSLRTISLHRPERPNSRNGNFMSVGLVLLIVLVLIMAGVVPAWPHSRGWGYGPSGAVGLVLLIIVILFLMGRI